MLRQLALPAAVLAVATAGVVLSALGVDGGVVTAMKAVFLIGVFAYLLRLATARPAVAIDAPIPSAPNSWQRIAGRIAVPIALALILAVQRWEPESSLQKGLQFIVLFAFVASLVPRLRGATSRRNR